jgi:hypothetical protein
MKTRLRRAGDLQENVTRYVRVKASYLQLERRKRNSRDHSTFRECFREGHWMSLYVVFCKANLTDIAIDDWLAILVAMMPKEIFEYIEVLSFVFSRFTF